MALARSRGVRTTLIWVAAAAVATAAGASAPVPVPALALEANPLCPQNNSYAPPLACPAGFHCCQQPWQVVCATGSSCTVCAECCHSELNATECASCVATSCTPGSVGAWGCEAAGSGECCSRGVPLPASASLPNVLLIGDSVTNGLFPVAASLLNGTALVQHIENVDAANEMACFDVQSADPMGNLISYDVIHFNEGLHSLWPRVNTSAELAAWGQTLANFTLLMRARHPNATFIYAPMTPYPPSWWLNPPGPPRQDVETKNAVAVAAVKGVGVQRFDDLYTVVTDACGPVPYKNCSLCDDEAIYHPGITCGYHYVEAGWQLLGQAVAASVREALAARGQLRG